MAWHVLPSDDIIEHEVSHECVCGPLIDTGEDENGPYPDGPVIVHHSLDGREFKEGRPSDPSQSES